MRQIWADTPAAQRPKIIGPDNDFDPGHTNHFPPFYPIFPRLLPGPDNDFDPGHTNMSVTLRAMAPFLHAFTYHK